MDKWRLDPGLPPPYWTQTVEKLAVVHTNFALGPRDREALMRGDAVLMAIASERLEAVED